MIYRSVEQQITKKLFKGKAILLLGPRQCGKTTLAQAIVQKTNKPTLWFNGDDADVPSLLQQSNTTKLKAIIGKNELVVIDEAQRIENIGIVIKLILDTIKNVQVIATGSSAFELANKINEPLTGRKFEYNLFPLSFSEMAASTNLLEEQRLLEHRMIYGYYPEIVTSPGDEENLLRLLSDSYLYKDLFALEQLKKPVLLQKILQALALQLGSEVSYHEIGQLTGADNETVEKYIDLLEKCYVVFKLPSLSRNMRNEIKKGRKVYFFDNGIRNSIIRNYSPLNLRNDKGALWENFLVAERWKRNEYSSYYPNRFFWRTHAQQEIDYIEEARGNLTGWEFKWSPKAKKLIPKTFLNGYPGSSITFIHTENFTDFVL